MFCVQCEQTIRTPAGNGCAYAQGMCGKTAETSDLQDLLVAALRGSPPGRCRRVRWASLTTRSTASPRALTLTNVNFDSQRIIGYARETLLLRDSLAARCRLLDAGVRVDHPMAALQLAGDDMPALLQQAAQFALNSDKAEVGDDVHGLRMLCLYGLKGAAAYMEHAHVLGQFDEQLYADYHAFMAWLGTPAARRRHPAEQRHGHRQDELQRDGDPRSRRNPGLRRSAAQRGQRAPGSRESHSDLRPRSERSAHAARTNRRTKRQRLHPRRNATGARLSGTEKFKHLVGNYGSGWQNQQTEFAKFPARS